ncbi:MAG: hypothetical protein IJG47_08260 [Microbacterium sp.]|nr:hypothetical protein [Microbacterium sp.]
MVGTLRRRKIVAAIAVAVMLSVGATESASALSDELATPVPTPSVTPQDQTELPEPAPETPVEPDDAEAPSTDTQPLAEESTPPSEKPEPDMVLRQDPENGDGNSVIPEQERSAILGSGWNAADDIAWATTGDADGLHVLTARSSSGYEWTRIATLSVYGFDTDRWVGNACLTSDATTLAVVYAPRGFTNDETLFNHGAFGALVNLETGESHQLGAGYTLAYFNPGCGLDSQVVFTQLDEARTRVVTFSSDSSEEIAAVEIAGQVTSAVPAESGLLAAASGAVIHIDSDGTTVPVAQANGTPYDLTVTGDGDLAYISHDGATATAFLSSASEDGAPIALATGELDELGIARSGDESFHVLGDPEVLVTELPATVYAHPDTKATSEISSSGQLAVNVSIAGAGGEADPNAPDAVQETIIVDATALESGTDIEFQVHNATGDVVASDDALGSAQLVYRSGGSPVCAVPRNDPAIQALQPNLAEVEWAVNQAVRGNLSAQTTFGRPALAGASQATGTTVPDQIMLGILAQESNFWQASRFTVPGVSGNPLMGDYYGIRSAAEGEPWWTIDYGAADCGYGIAQVTTGMESGDMPYSQQLMIATDYRANISRGLQILIDKWNQTRAAGLTINNGDPKYLENWFYALWAYNTGFYPETSASQPWGVGWLNNPINPIYPPNRSPFLDGSPGDASHPQDWPYPEKVLGFAAHSAYFLNSVSQGPLGDTFNYGTAFSPAWWASTDGNQGVTNRKNVKPPIDLFCDASNNCDPNTSIYIPSEGYSAPCYNQVYAGGPYDLKCWYHKPATWKSNCSNLCGYQSQKYTNSDPKPASSNSYPANCTTNGLPSGALIVDNVPNGTPAQRCGSVVSTTGSFQLTFAPGPNGDYPSKIDTHQLGAGFNGHFYFSRVRLPSVDAAEAQHLAVSGTWDLGQSLAGKWTRVMVHMPSHGAWSQQASYEINTGSTTVVRSVNQRNYADKWVSLGTFQMTGTPTVTLRNNTATYSDDDKAEALHGVDDIAWDAVAFVPLAQKPSDFIVALGDSFSSGEGTSAGDGSDFFRGSDHHGSDPNSQNACHRSPYAWPYKIDVPNVSGSASVGTLASTNDSRLDFHMLACAGAETKNMYPTGTSANYATDQQFGERTQLDRGFLDANTTLVTMTIGGNDVGFGPILKACITSPGVLASPATECKVDPAPAETEFSGTIEQMVDSRLAALPGKITSVLQEIKQRAGNARIILLGYPTLFENGTLCVALSESNKSWLNSVSQRLNQALTKAAFDAGTYVTYESPQYRFSGHNVCADNPALRRLVLTTTPGDAGTWIQPPNAAGFGISAQSVHPNQFGTDLYAQAANNAVASERVPLSATLTAGAPTTYYATLRWMEGPTAMSISSFSSCGQELRLGLRSGGPGTQSTNSLSWTSPHDKQNFLHAPDSLNTPDLPGNTYAMNARLTTACPGGGNQTWTGDLYR